MQLISRNESEMDNMTQVAVSGIEEPHWVPLDTVIGLILAFSSTLFIGVSIIFKKLALRDIEVSVFSYSYSSK